VSETETTHAEVGHCPTCHCQRDDTDHLTVYPPVEKIYGRCDTCGQIRWHTEWHHNVYSKDGGWRERRPMHCGCCTHPHDLANGGHTVPCRCPDVAVGS